MSSMTNDIEEQHVKDILKLYMQYFNGFLQETLKKVCRIVEEDRARSELGGASLGATAANLTERAISPAEKVAPAVVQLAVDFFKVKQTRATAASLVDAICAAKLQDLRMRRVIAFACFEIVRSYEEIFVHVSADGNWLAAIITLADEAATAVIDYLTGDGAGSPLTADTFLDAVRAIDPEVPGNVFARAITKLCATVRSLVKRSTGDLTLGDGTKVSASKLYSQVGLVDDDGTSYVLKGRKQCNKHRYRRTFPGESIDAKDYVIEENHPCKNYTFVFDRWCKEDVIEELMNEFDKTNNDVVDEITKKVNEMAVNIVKENNRQQPKATSANVNIEGNEIGGKWTQKVKQGSEKGDANLTVTNNKVNDWDQVVDQS